MRTHKYYRNPSEGVLEIKLVKAQVRRLADGSCGPRSPGLLDHNAARAGFRKTKKPYKRASPVPTRRYMANLRRAAQNPGRG